MEPKNKLPRGLLDLYGKTEQPNIPLEGCSLHQCQALIWSRRELGMIPILGKLGRSLQFVRMGNHAMPSVRTPHSSHVSEKIGFSLHLKSWLQELPQGGWFLQHAVHLEKWKVDSQQDSLCCITVARCSSKQSM